MWSWNSISSPMQWRGLPKLLLKSLSVWKFSGKFPVSDRTVCSLQISAEPMSLKLLSILAILTIKTRNSNRPSVLIFTDLHIFKNWIILTWKKYLKNTLARFLFTILEIYFPVSYLLEISGSVAILFIFYMFSFFISMLIFLSLFLCQKMTDTSATCPSHNIPIA